MKKVFITGANGYIGSNLIPVLLKAGFIVNVLIRNKEKINLIKHPRLKIFLGDLDNLKVLKKATENVSIVCHLAAALSTFEKNNILYESNIKGLKSIISVCQNNKSIKKFIFASSIDAITKNSDYARSKLAGEKIVNASFEKTKFNIIRIGNVNDTSKNTGVVSAIVDIVKKNNWQSSILYHQLGNKKVYPIELSKLIDELIKLFSSPSIKIVDLFEKPITIKEIINYANNKKNITIPKRHLFNQPILLFWKILGKFFKRADLLIYFSYSK